MDKRWWRWHNENLRNFNGIIAHCAKKVRDGKLKKLKRGKTLGIDTNPTKIAPNKSSGASAINLAYHLGAKRIVLIGFDMRKIGGNNNWHKDHPKESPNPYYNFLKAFPLIKKDADELNLEILNATSGSAIKSFPIVDLRDVVNDT